MLLIEKLYFTKQEKKANLYVITYSFIHFFLLIFLSLIFKNQFITIFVTLLASIIFIIICISKNLKISFQNFSLLKYIKYDSNSLFSHILFLITYCIGLSNSFGFGEKYVLAISFFTLITDMQWDISYNVDTLAKIDISQNQFNYKKHQKNALILSVILNISIILLFLILYPFYKPNLIITLIFTIPTLIDLLIVPFYNLKKDYLQINVSPIKVTTITQVANILRTLCSFLLTPYCTLIGQEVTIYLQLISFYIMFSLNCKITPKGEIENIKLST